MWGLCARVVLTTSLVFTWAWSVNSAWSCMYGSLSLCSHTFRHSKSGSQCQLQYIQQRHNQVKIALETHVGIYIHSLTWVTQCHLAHLSQPIQNTSVWITYWTHRYISLLELLSHITRDTLHCLVYDGRSLFQTRETAVLRSLLCVAGRVVLATQRTHRVENASGTTMGAWTSVFPLLYILFDHCPSSTNKPPPPPCTYTHTLHLAPEGSLGKKWSVQGPLCQY